jgi:hypothetical protein
MRFAVSIIATIDCASSAEAVAQTDRIRSLLQSSVTAALLRSKGVKLVGPPSVGKPEEKK